MHIWLVASIAWVPAFPFLVSAQKPTVFWRSQLLPFPAHSLPAAMATGWTSGISRLSQFCIRSLSRNAQSEAFPSSLPDSMMKPPKPPEATCQPQERKWVLSETAQPQDAAQLNSSCIISKLLHSVHNVPRTAACLAYTTLSCCFGTGSGTHDAFKVAEFLCLAYHRKSSSSLY